MSQSHPATGDLLPLPAVREGVDGLPELAEATHEFLKALASPSRQRIMLLFARGAELSVNEVAERAGLGQSNASQQLALLKRGKVLTSRRDGKGVLYRADREGTSSALADLQRYLTICC
ncbi:transcriptional regulator, ArsR family [Kribbella flavida DSM 17836]|uniref:Transcriptional regulator, ArsR family n=1 Tax=Kribbella flavida (strain DSM 17836 / JCM 10339 / NBRC 14399) TaxID=479435 RepID=D2PQ25_KRIFD|nr:metalloregulator ArsR/SmtB family transcription factor [Kribbella flavida]ADB32949.1 transcriptional regulator, ArsR family [Kribbella flavida DSM 17836]